MDRRFSAPTAAAVERARQHSVGDLLHRTARRYPGKLAVVAGDRRATYADFDLAVNRAAHALAARGVTKGDRLALLSHNCWQYAVLVFATAKLGVVLVPVNFMLNADEIAFIVGHSGATGMVAEAALAPTAERALATAGVEGGVRGWIGPDPAAGWEDVDAWWQDGDGTAPDVRVADDDPLRLMYTSGTESRPKGVMLSSRSLIAQYVSCVIDGGMSVEGVEAHALPLYHCAQLDCFFSVDVYLGATSVILPGPDPAALLATVARERVTKLFCPPTVWISLLRHPDFDRTDLSSLRKGSVFGVDHPHWIEAVTAVVVPKAGAALTSEQVREHARGRLAPYKCPKYVVLADALPKNPSGKILKRELRQRHADLARDHAP